jgi:hypothetical protein
MPLPNQQMQAAPDCAFCLFLSQWPGAPDLDRSPKAMLPLSLILLSCLLAPVAARSAGTNDAAYIAKMITCSQKDERYVAQAYDAFLTLAAGRALGAGELRFPAAMIEKDGGFVIIERAYYVSPNELRGFELFVPRELLAEKGGVLVSTAPLSVSQSVTRQGITSFTLQKKEANPQGGPNRKQPSGSETNRTSAAAASRRSP